MRSGGARGGDGGVDGDLPGVAEDQRQRDGLPALERHGVLEYHVAGERAQGQGAVGGTARPRHGGWPGAGMAPR